MFFCPTMQWMARIPILSVPPHSQGRKGGTQTLRFVKHLQLGQNIRAPRGRDLSGQAHPLWIRHGGRSDGAQFCPPLPLSWQGLSAVPWRDNSGAGQWKGCREQAQDKHCPCPKAAAPAAGDAAGFTGLGLERTEQTRDPGRGNPIFRKKPGSD